VELSIRTLSSPRLSLETTICGGFTSLSIDKIRCNVIVKTESVAFVSLYNFDLLTPEKVKLVVKSCAQLCRQRIYGRVIVAKPRNFNFRILASEYDRECVTATVLRTTHPHTQR
jgi:hypothetical protein